MLVKMFWNRWIGLQWQRLVVKLV